MMQSQKRFVIIGVVMFVLFVGLVYIGANAHKGLPGTPETIVRAAFENSGGVRAGDDVRIARVRVGRVDSIEVVNGRPLLTLALIGERAVYADARAILDSRSGLGQRIVDLDPGTPEAGPLGDRVIGFDRTQSAVGGGVSNLVSVFDAPTRDALSSTLQQVGGGLGGRAGDLSDLLQTSPELLPNLQTVAQSVNINQGEDLTSFLRAADTLAGRFEGREQQISDVTRDLATTLDGLNPDGGKPLRETLDRAPATLRNAGAALGEVQPALHELSEATDRLRPGAESLGKAMPDFRGFLRESPRALNKVPDVSEEAVPALDGLTKSVDALGPLAPRLTQTLQRADPILSTLAPYSPELVGFFDNFASALSNGPAGKGDPNQRYLRITLLFGSTSVTGNAGQRDPTVCRKPYPAPGESAKDRCTIGGQG